MPIPQQLSPVPVMRKGKLAYAAPEEVEYEMPSSNSLFTDTINMIPMVSSIKGARALMGAKFSISGESTILVRRLNGEIYMGPISDYVFREGDVSPSVDKTSKKITWIPVLCVSSHEFDGKFYRVSFKSGRHVDATEHHSFVTMGDNGDLVEIEPQNMENFCPVPTAGELEVESLHTEFIVPDGKAHNAISGSTIKLDFDFGWLIGLYLAGGSITRGEDIDGDISGVFWAALDAEINKRGCDILKSLGDNVSLGWNRNRHGVPFTFGAYWKQLGVRIEEEFGSGSDNKKIPGWVLFSPKEFREGVVSGYMAGNGTVWTGKCRGMRVGATTNSIELRDGFSMLLLTLGIRSSVSSSFSVGKGRYRISVCSQDIGRLPRTFHKKKDERLSGWVDIQKRGNDWIPVYGKLRPYILEKTKRGTRDRNYLRGNNLSKKIISRLLGDSAAEICPWVDSGITWDLVSSVEELEKKRRTVYDLHMDDNLFMCGTGVFVHNTTQSLPLSVPEAPLVDAEDEETGDFYGRKIGQKVGMVTSPYNGVVSKISNDAIFLKDAAGKSQEIPLRYFYPHNKKTYTTDRPLVNVGDKVTAGQNVAHSNFVTPEGDAAFGANLRVAYMPGHQGRTFEDAIMVSESAAKRLTSSHMYNFTVDNKLGVQSNKKKFQQLFPNKYTNEQLDKIDENGMVKPGVELNAGDPIFLSFSPRTIKAVDRAKGNLHKIIKNSFIDNSQTWDKPYTGKAIDAVENRSGYSVNITGDVPLQFGDKLCLSPDHDVLTADGWKPIQEILLEDKVATLSASGEIEFINPEARNSHFYSGPMYDLSTTQVSVCSTLNHRAYVDRQRMVNRVDGYKNKYSLVEVSELIGKKFKMKKNGEWTGGSTPDSVSISYSDGKNLHVEKKLKSFVFTPQVYLSLLGAFLSEGSLFRRGAGKDSAGSGIKITQTKQPNRDKLVKFLNDNKINFCETHDKDGVIIYGKALYNHFLNCGEYSYLKRIPNEIFSWKKEDLLILLEWLMWGDGSTTKTSMHYFTASRQLADDVQRLAFLCGYAASIDHKIAGDKNTKTTYKSGGVFIKDSEIKPFRDRYIVSISKKKLYPEINHGHKKAQNGQSEKVIQYTGTIHCLTFEKNNVFYVRRNGKTHWTGNSSRYANKGVTAVIQPDDRMFKDKDGNTIDILINPASVIGRVNPASIYEALLGKVASKTGKRYKVPGFSEDSMLEFVKKELADNQISDTEDLYDPVTERMVPNILTGKQYIMKLEHQAGDKWSAVDEAATDQNQQPGKPGGHDSAKRIGYLDTMALLSHGATENLADIQQYRSGANQDMWRRIRMGLPLPAPEVPFIYDKFINTLRGAGINTSKKGSKIFINALKKKDIDELVGNREILNSETIDPITKEPIKGGLMDMALHGIDGKRWSYIKLDEKIPNPILEEPLRKILGITKQKMLGIIAGKEQIEGRTGPQALYDAYQLLDKRKLEEDLKSTIRSGRKTARDLAIKRLNALSGFKNQGIEADDLFMDKVPVLPAAFRPVSAFGKLMLSADPNYLYKDLISARDLHRTTITELGESEAGEEAVAMYNALAAVQGLGDPIHPKTAQKGVKGFIRSLSAGGPKCYDDETEILTENGWVPFPAYNDNSIKVATLNPETEEMEFQSPTEITHEMYSGNMVHTKTTKIDLLVTECHQHYVEQVVKSVHTEDGNKKRYRELQKAKKITARELCGKTKSVQYITAASKFNGFTPNYIFQEKEIDPVVFAKLVGWWVAEGWATHYKGRPSALHIAQKTGSSGEAEIDKIFESLGLPFSRKINITKKDGKLAKAGYRSTHWSLYLPDLCKWMVDNCGSKSYNKQLSSEILSWEQDHQLELLKAYLHGDGEKRETVSSDKQTYQNMSCAISDSSRFSTTSERLIGDIELLCLQCGLGFKRTDEFYEDHEKWAKQYRGRIYGWNRVIVEHPEQTKLIENWSGMVHCVTVPNGLIFVRRNRCVAVSGNSGMFLSKVIGHTVNTVGRGVVVPNAELDMDEIGIPENIAWKLYAPFVMRRLVKAGMPAQQAALNIERRTDFSKKFLLQEMDERPVLYNRAPSLHKFNVMASKPRLVTGDGIHISPLAIKPMNMDFDGDAINVHVPISDGAVAEAKKKLMPSQNLFDIRERKVHYVPSQEFTLGLWSSSVPNKEKKAVKYKTTEEAIQAYKNGEIDIDTPVEIS